MEQELLLRNKLLGFFSAAILHPLPLLFFFFFFRLTGVLPQRRYEATFSLFAQHILWKKCFHVPFFNLFNHNVLTV